MPDWPHAPVHRLGEAGAFMVTGATYRKERFFDAPDRLRLAHGALVETAREFGWRLQAWAVLPNHYHFLAQSPPDARSLKALVSRLHATTARQVNRLDQTPGRRVWYQYWDSHITHQSSYLARLKYVNENAVKHGLVARATQWPFCSAE